MSAYHRTRDVLALRLRKPQHISVMLVLAYHWNASKRLAWPSVPTLARLTGWGERKVQYALRELEALGSITAASTKKGGRAGRLSTGSICRLRTV